MANRLTRTWRRDHSGLTRRRWMAERLDLREQRRGKQAALDREAGPREARRRREAREAWWREHCQRVEAKIRAALERERCQALAHDIDVAAAIARRFEADVQSDKQSA